MFRLCVRDHFMIAHSFKGEIFGPAQRTHGATYVVDVVFQRPELDEDGLVIDIGLASETVKSVLAGYNFSNLDEVPEFNGKNGSGHLAAHRRHPVQRSNQRRQAGCREAHHQWW